MRFGPLHGFLMGAITRLTSSVNAAASFVQIGKLDRLSLGSQKSFSHILVFQFRKRSQICLRCCLMGFLGQRENL